MVCKRAGRARRAAQRYRDGGGHRPEYPKVSREESVAVRVLFDILLRRMRARGCMAEMTYLPRQAKSLDEFHSKNITKFEGWLRKSYIQQYLTLRTFILAKFSLDPNYEVLVPSPGAPRLVRNNAQWHGFKLTDKDMSVLIDDVMISYAQAMSSSEPYETYWST